MNGEILYQQIEEELNLDRMVRHITEIGRLHRYTGTPQGEQFVDELTAKLEAVGIPYTVDQYEAYTSLPISASLTLECKEQLPAIADVYSGSAENLSGELIYDVWSEKKKLSPNEDMERFNAFRNKLVLSHASGGFFAQQVFQAGGKGILHINYSPGGYIHHNNISTAWGTPCGSAPLFLNRIPSAGISLEDGKNLIARLQQGPLQVMLNIVMDTAVHKSRMPVVEVPGKSEKFILINGHYDSWYEGITDNAASDAILLELARVFWKHREQLERSVRIAWWSGHSDARYAGSAWYCDHHWEELNKNCVASINLDLAGCKLAKQIRARTTCMEGDALTASVIREYTGMEAKPFIPMIRGADQSFWGVHVPISIMLKYEPIDEDRVSPCPSGGPWWHTDQDTLDKLDPEILLRDTRINARLACILVDSAVLPVQIANYARLMRGFLQKINATLSEDFCLAPVLESMEAFIPLCEKLDEAIGRTSAGASDRIVKRVAGELTRLTYSSGSCYQQDPSSPYVPFGNLESACGLTRDQAQPEVYVFKLTEFRRAVNRLCGQLSELSEDIERYLADSVSK